MFSIFSLLGIAPPVLLTLIVLMANSQDGSLKRLRIYGTILSVILLCVSLFCLSHPGFQSWANQLLIDLLFSFTFGTLVAIVGLWVGPPLIQRVNKIRKEAEEEQETEEVAAVDSPADSPNPGETCNRYVLIIGDQLVGKTQLIRTLCGDFRPVNISERTGQANDEKRYRIVYGPTYSSQRLVFVDHRGQDFGTIAEALSTEGLTGADIHAIVLMTDLFDFPTRQNGQSDAEWDEIVEEFMYGQKGAHDPDRVATHREQLSKASLDQLLVNNGLGPVPETGGGLRSIFLFINKIDKLKDWNRDLTNESYIEHFKKIQTSLERRARDMKETTGRTVATDWCAGSAMQGWGIAGKGRLLDALISDPTEQDADA